MSKSKIFDEKYTAGIILEHMYNNAGGKLTYDKIKKLNLDDFHYILGELKLMENDDLVKKDEFEQQYLDTGKPAKPLVYYRITSKGYSFVNGLLKDNKALNNTYIAIGLSVLIPIIMFVAGKKWDYLHPQQKQVCLEYKGCAGKYTSAYQNPKIYNGIAQDSVTSQNLLSLFTITHIADSVNQRPKN